MKCTMDSFWTNAENIKRVVENYPNQEFKNYLQGTSFNIYLH